MKWSQRSRRWLILGGIATTLALVGGTTAAVVNATRNEAPNPANRLAAVLAQNDPGSSPTPSQTLGGNPLGSKTLGSPFGPAGSGITGQNPAPTTPQPQPQTGQPTTTSPGTTPTPTPSHSGPATTAQQLAINPAVIQAWNQQGAVPTATPTPANQTVAASPGYFNLPSAVDSNLAPLSDQTTKAAMAGVYNWFATMMQNRNNALGFNNTAIQSAGDAAGLPNRQLLADLLANHFIIQDDLVRQSLFNGNQALNLNTPNALDLMVNPMFAYATQQASQFNQRFIQLAMQILSARATVSMAVGYNTYATTTVYGYPQFGSYQAVATTGENQTVPYIPQAIIRANWNYLAFLVYTGAVTNFTQFQTLIAQTRGLTPADNGNLKDIINSSNEGQANVASLYFCPRDLATTFAQMNIPFFVNPAVLGGLQNVSHTQWNAQTYAPQTGAGLQTASGSPIRMFLNYNTAETTPDGQFVLTPGVNLAIARQGATGHPANANHFVDPTTGATYQSVAINPAEGGSLNGDGGFMSALGIVNALATSNPQIFAFSTGQAITQGWNQNQALFTDQGWLPITPDATAGGTNFETFYSGSTAVSAAAYLANIATFNTQIHTVYNLLTNGQVVTNLATATTPTPIPQAGDSLLFTHIYPTMLDRAVYTFSVGNAGYTVQSLDLAPMLSYGITPMTLPLLCQLDLNRAYFVYNFSYIAQANTLNQDNFSLVNAPNQSMDYVVPLNQLLTNPRGAQSQFENNFTITETTPQGIEANPNTALTRIYQPVNNATGNVFPGYTPGPGIAGTTTPAIPNTNNLYNHQEMLMINYYQLIWSNNVGQFNQPQDTSGTGETQTVPITSGATAQGFLAENQIQNDEAYLAHGGTLNITLANNPADALVVQTSTNQGQYWDGTYPQSGTTVFTPGVIHSLDYFPLSYPLMDPNQSGMNTMLWTSIHQMANIPGTSAGQSGNGTPGVVPQNQPTNSSPTSPTAGAGGGGSDHNPASPTNPNPDGQPNGQQNGQPNGQNVPVTDSPQATQAGSTLDTGASPAVRFNFQPFWNFVAYTATTANAPNGFADNFLEWGFDSFLNRYLDTTWASPTGQPITVDQNLLPNPYEAANSNANTPTNTFAYTDPAQAFVSEGTYVQADGNNSYFMTELPYSLNQTLGQMFLPSPNPITVSAQTLENNPEMYFYNTATPGTPGHPEAPGQGEFYQAAKWLNNRIYYAAATGGNGQGKLLMTPNLEPTTCWAQLNSTNGDGQQIFHFTAVDAQNLAQIATVPREAHLLHAWDYLNGLQAAHGSLDGNFACFITMFNIGSTAQLFTIDNLSRPIQIQTTTDGKPLQTQATDFTLFQPFMYQPAESVFRDTWNATGQLLKTADVAGEVQLFQTLTKMGLLITNFSPVVWTQLVDSGQIRIVNNGSTATTLNVRVTIPSLHYENQGLSGTYVADAKAPALTFDLTVAGFDTATSNGGAPETQRITQSQKAMRQEHQETAANHRGILIAEVLGGTLASLLGVALGSFGIYYAVRKWRK